jgi:tRNA splicing ligase
MNWVYILEERAAEPGEYVEHKETGEIKLVMSVDEDGAVLHSVYMILGGCGDIDREYWQLGEYVVLRKVTDPVFSIEMDSTL